MTISSTINSAGPYTGDTVGPFAFAFKVFTASDILVIRQDINDVETTLTKDADYTVQLNDDQNNTPGGNIYLTTSLGVDSLAIVRFVEFTQPLDIQSAGGWNPEVVEDAFDRLTIQVQQLKTETDRSLKLSLFTEDDPEDFIAAVQAAADDAQDALTAAEAAQAAAEAAQAAAEGAAQGEINTASNLGAGSEVFKAKTGVNFAFRTLSAGVGVTLTQNADDIEIAAAGASSYEDLAIAMAIALG